MPLTSVVVIAQPGAYPFDLGIPARVFGALDDRYEVRLCTIDGLPITTNAGFDVVPAHDGSALASADLVVVAPVDPRWLRRGGDPDVVAALRALPPSTVVMSICTGAFTLAAAGMLDGCTGATHWECSDLFTQWYPHLTMNREVLFADNGRIVTAAGAAAGIDTCLHLIRREHGAAVAAQAARRCVAPPWRDGGQAQYIRAAVPEVSESGTATARAYALEHLDAYLSVDSLARQASMSARTFIRRFRDETGETPGQWLITQRVERARLLLEETDLTVDAIASRVGFATATSLRDHFRSHLGVTPVSYRRTFGSAARAAR